ncbi:unnamed protein product [Amoebophrya sp. A120]|nr:unnamed protein product [Amoebophrya sp. A120]|eukprot:GSA120T00016542001.1
MNSFSLSFPTQRDNPLLLLHEKSEGAALYSTTNSNANVNFGAPQKNNSYPHGHDQSYFPDFAMNQNSLLFQHTRETNTSRHHTHFEDHNRGRSVERHGLTKYQRNKTTSFTNQNHTAPGALKKQGSARINLPFSSPTVSPLSEKRPSPGGRARNDLQSSPSNRPPGSLSVDTEKNLNSWHQLQLATSTNMDVSQLSLEGGGSSGNEQKRGRSSKRSSAARAQKEGKEEKEFKDQTTKKNLNNVQLKLSRNMAELQESILPIMLQNQMSDKKGGSEMGSKSSSKRKSTFGSEEAEVQAKRMAQVMLNGKGQQGQLLAALNADIVASKAVGTKEHPLETQDLRQLIKIDDRIEMSKIGAARYRAVSEEELLAAQARKDEEDRIKREEAERKARRMEDDDQTPSPLNQPRTPRMRHVRSYRCATARDLQLLRKETVRSPDHEKHKKDLSFLG